MFHGMDLHSLMQFQSANSLRLHAVKDDPHGHWMLLGPSYGANNMHCLKHCRNDSQIMVIEKITKMPKESLPKVDLFYWMFGRFFAKP